MSQRQVWGFELKENILTMNLTVTKVESGSLIGTSEVTKDTFKIIPYSAEGLFDNLSLYSQVKVGDKVITLPVWGDHRIAYFDENY